MTLDTFIKIAGVVGLIVSYGTYRFFCKNTYLTYKDQRVGVRTKWRRR